MIDFAAARKKMVENQLRTAGITDHRLLSVMAQIPRERFVPEARRDLAYIDDNHRLPSTDGVRYLSAPAPFARLVQLAAVGTDDSVLDLASGCGYGTAILAELAAHVVAVESDSGLAAMTRQNLADLGLDNVTVVEGPIVAGAPKRGPYDVIIVEGAIEQTPRDLFGQLAENGRMVTLEKHGATAVAHLYTRAGKDVASRAEFNANLPALGNGHTAPSFVF